MLFTELEKKGTETLDQWEGALSYALSLVKYLKKRAEIYDPEQSRLDTIIRNVLGNRDEEHRRRVLAAPTRAADIPLADAAVAIDNLRLSDNHV
jgi:hypothetical protein